MLSLFSTNRGEEQDMRKYRKPYKERVKLQYTVKFITDFAVAVCVAYFLIITFGERFTIVGNSMKKELNNKDIVLINKAVYEFKDPERFDVVLFEAEGINEGKCYVKRIIALPGETIYIQNGKIYVNDMILVNDVTDVEVLTPGLASAKITLGENEYFVLGDNRNNSEDSRFYTIGNVKKENIIGQPWLKVYPFNAFGLVE